MSEISKTSETTTTTPPEPEGWQLTVWRYQERLRAGRDADGEVCSDGFIFSRRLTLADWLMNQTQCGWSEAYHRARVCATKLSSYEGGKRELVRCAQQLAASMFFALCGLDDMGNSRQTQE